MHLKELLVPSLVGDVLSAETKRHEPGRLHLLADLAVHEPTQRVFRKGKPLEPR